ncbi:VWA domain-containing protein [Bacillus sp. FJAT-27245]|uniref:VWA domain-containing protein n=1 Tax=Bacillus sp. FJAT-27245 TaxID=1684144 RepID=UPI0006A76CD3|nr:VWA domain-containing protein [Bacillus sp. FJAT-27245]
MGLDVKYPLMFALVLPAAFLMYRFFSREGTLEQKIIGLIRSVVFFILILALAAPQIVFPAKTETVIFLVDRSKSVEAAGEEALDWIHEAVSKKGPGMQFAIASFAKEPQSESSLAAGGEIPSQFSGDLDKTETDIGSGLRFASSLIPGAGAGRIVLLTDGNNTAGEAATAARMLKNRKIELDYATLRKAAGNDAAVTSFTVPPTLYEGEKTSVSVAVSSNAEMEAVLRLTLNNREILKKDVSLKEGNNAFTFTHRSTGTGLSVYKAELINSGDAHIENNSLFAVADVKGVPKVLVVEGTPGGRMPAILRESGLAVDAIVPERLPTALGGYLNYQSIVFENVPGHRVSEGQMDLLEKAVREFGTGFVMTGGEDSFGLGGYFKTPLEKLLPVDMDIKGKKEMPSLGLVIVIDRSGSMEGAKFSLAKEAAARSAELLRKDDTLGFIAFDDKPWVIVETAPLKNKQDAIEKIRSVAIGGGTNIYPALEKAYGELRDLKLQRKHIILLTDGQSATDWDYAALIEEGKKRNITISTLALGSDADRRLLEELAKMGSGRFYDVSDASVIPSVLSRETVMTTRTYIEDDPFYPVIGAYPEWKVLFENGVPQMNAYVAVTPKPRARVPVLSEKDDPVLAQWQYGLGSTLAFTSGLSGKWSGDWARWPNWPGFINQIVSESLPKYESEPFSVSVDKDKGNAVISLSSGNADPIPIEATVLTQAGEAIDANTKLVSPGKYELVIPGRHGMYYLSIRKKDKDGVSAVYRTGFSVPYSEEFLLKGTNKVFLNGLVSISGGKELASPKDAFRPLSSKPSTKQPVSEYLLLAAFLLLIAEIFLRRFGTGVLGKLIPKRKTPGKTGSDAATVVLGRLAKAKDRTVNKAGLKNPGPHVPEKDKPIFDKTETPPFPPHDSKQAAEKRPAPHGSAATGAEDRMKRLLEAKKRRR